MTEACSRILLSDYMYLDSILIIYPLHFVDGFYCMLTSSVYVSCLSVKATYLSRHLHTLTVPGAYWPAWNFLHSPHNDISQDPDIRIRPLLFFGQLSKYWTKYLCYVGNCSIEIMFTCSALHCLLLYSKFSLRKMYICILQGAREAAAPAKWRGSDVRWNICQVLWCLWCSETCEQQGGSS
jgi:hypothetical protein